MGGGLRLNEPGQPSRRGPIRPELTTAIPIYFPPHVTMFLRCTYSFLKYFSADCCNQFHRSVAGVFGREYALFDGFLCARLVFGHDLYEFRRVIRGHFHELPAGVIDASFVWIPAGPMARNQVDHFYLAYRDREASADSPMTYPHSLTPLLPIHDRCFLLPSPWS